MSDRMTDSKLPVLDGLLQLADWLSVGCIIVRIEVNVLRDNRKPHGSAWLKGESYNNCHTSPHQSQSIAEVVYCYRSVRVSASSLVQQS